MNFIESIKYENGIYENLDLHQERIDRTFKFHFPKFSSHNLQIQLPKLAIEGTYKVRVIYDNEKVNVEYAKYIPRKIESLEVIHGSLTYPFKYEKRDQFEQLRKESFADDVIICVEDNVTDSSYANLVFWDGIEWFTPETFLLNGVKRQQLLLEAKIKEAPIQKNDIGAFKKVSLINAMLDLGDLEIPTGAIKKYSQS